MQVVCRQADRDYGGASMIKAKNGNIIFRNTAELNNEIMRKMSKAVETYHKTDTKNALNLFKPLALNALYEVPGVGEKRINQFLDRFNVHMECLQDGVVTPEEYRDWCLEQGYKVVEVENVRTT